MSNPLKHQVAGDHYRTMAVQPIEAATAQRFDPCAFSILKYVTRHRRKSGREDVLKAKHFKQLREHMLLWPPAVTLGEFCDANGITGADWAALAALAAWCASGDEEAALALDAALDRLLEEYPEPKPPSLRAIGRAVGRSASTIIRWRDTKPALFEAVRQYAERQRND